MAPPVRMGYNQRSPHDQTPYQDSTTTRGVGGHGGYRGVTHGYEYGEGEGLGEFEGEAYQGGDEEVQEQEPYTETFEEGEGYPGGEPVEDEYGEQAYTAQNDEDYGEGEVEDDGGYNY
jgi:hypothetical protein